MQQNEQEKFLQTAGKYFKKDVFYHDIVENPDDPFTHILKHPIPQTSWKLTDWVIRFSNLKGKAKLVSAQIASFYNAKDKYSYPTYDDLMKSTGLSHSSIKRAIKEMKLSGEWLVIATNQTSYVRHTNNRYFYLAPTQYDKFMSDDEFSQKIESFNELKAEKPFSSLTVEELKTYPRLWEPRITFSTLEQYDIFRKRITKSNNWYNLKGNHK